MFFAHVFLQRVIYSPLMQRCYKLTFNLSINSSIRTDHTSVLIKSKIAV